MRQREKKTKKCSDSPCTTQTNNLKYSMTIEKQTRVPRTPVAFRREGFKRVNEDMQTMNNNTLTKKGETIMDFDNGIFCTVPCDRLEGVVWIVRKADGERITFCRGYDDVMFCVAELMKQRLGL